MAEPKVRNKPFAIATSKGKVASLSTLSQFAIKSASTDSRVIDETEDPFEKVYGDEGLVEPKYNPGDAQRASGNEYVPCQSSADISSAPVR